jgi:hypothetical protein
MEYKNFAQYLGLITSCLSFFGFGFLNLADRLKIKHEAISRTLQIRDDINLADFKIQKLLLTQELNDINLFDIATKELSPSLDKFATLYQQGMLNKFLASKMVRLYYNSLLIEISHFAIYKKFHWYSMQEWSDIKQKTKKEQKALRKQKDDFLKTTFPDFYDIHFSLRHNIRSYIVKCVVFVFNKIPSKAKQSLQTATKWLKSILHIKKLADFYATFISPLIAPCIVSVGIYFVIYLAPSLPRYFKTKKDSPHLSNATSTTKPLDNPVKMDKTKAK